MHNHSTTPLWHVWASIQQQVKIGNVPCMKFHKYELTIHTNTWYTFLGYVEPNEKWHHFPVWYSLHYVEERAPLFWQNLSTLFSGGTQVRCNARHQFLLYQWMVVLVGSPCPSRVQVEFGHLDCTALLIAIIYRPCCQSYLPKSHFKLKVATAIGKWKLQRLCPSILRVEE
jgi:hypothetical protein